MGLKKTLIFGVTGQDGSLLSKLLLEKQYKVYGVARRTSTDNTQRLVELAVLNHPSFSLLEGDISDPFSVNRCFNEADLGETDEVYNLAAQSHVHTSFNQPKYTLDVNLIGTLNILEKMVYDKRGTRLYFAATSEMFGNSVDTDGYQRETTPMNPCSPYAIWKHAAFNLVRNYREAYGLHASSGILFNHESPLRGDNFVTKKITSYVAGLFNHLNSLDGFADAVNGRSYHKLKLGNINSYRDWGYAPDYCKAMHLMLQQDKPDDYVIATGETHSVMEFVKLVFDIAHIDYNKHLEIDDKLYRPSDLVYLKGDSSKAREKLGWQPTISLAQLARVMFNADYQKFSQSSVHQVETGGIS